MKEKKSHLSFQNISFQLTAELKQTGLKKVGV